MSSEVEYTDQFEEWWDALTTDEQRRTEAAVEVLQERGPGLGRPWVDTLEGSRHPNMKELRPRGGHTRILFARPSPSCDPASRRRQERPVVELVRAGDSPGRRAV